MVTHEEGEKKDIIWICNIPVRSQTKPCTTEVLPLFHSMWKGEENGRLFVNKPKKTHLTFT